MRKYDIEYVKNILSKSNYTLVSTEYKNPRTKLHCICSNGHRHDICFDKFLGGKRCRICYCKNQSIKYKREGNPNWKPYKTEFERIHGRHYKELDDWRLLVYKKFNYKCVITNSNKNIEAHHLYSWNAFPDVRFDVNNGIVINKKYHNDFHIAFGNGNNTPLQFFTWLSYDFQI